MTVTAERIDAAAAWRILRRLARPDAAGTEAGPAQTDARLPPLELAADGSWSSPCPVSAGAAELFDIYGPLCARPGPYVFAQLGQSLDGRIAAENGASCYINGPEGLTHLHRLRALADAIVVGAATATTDNPALTVRRVEGDQPARVVIDSRCRVPAGLNLFHDGAAETLLLHADDAPRAAPGQATALALPRGPEGLAIDTILATLHERGYRRILIEGGGLTVSRFLQAGRLDRLHIAVAPRLLGSGRPALTLAPIDCLDDALQPAWRRFELGEDMLFDLDFAASD